MLDLAELQICPRKQAVRHGGREAKLPDLSFRLLRLLGERAPEPVSFAEIEAEVWGARVTRETIKQRARLLRESLSAVGAPADAVEAVRNVGYRATLSVAPFESQARSRPGARTLWACAAVGALVVFAAIAAAAVSRTSASPLSMTVISEAPPPSADPLAWEGVRRTLIRDFASMRGVDVVAFEPKGRVATDLLVTIAAERIGGGDRLSLQLVETESETVLWAATYAFDPLDHERALMHFENHAHATVETLSLRLGRNGYPRQPREVQTLYLSALELARAGGEQDLLAARSKLEAALARRPHFTLARSLRARVDADLVLRHGRPRDSARAALRDAKDLVRAHPEVAEFKYALARAEMAAGDDAAALDHLRAAERAMPFLKRDVQVLERRLSAAGARGSPRQLRRENDRRL